MAGIAATAATGHVGTVMMPVTRASPSHMSCRSVEPKAADDRRQTNR
jgi:hypothetical protein